MTGPSPAVQPELPAGPRRLAVSCGAVEVDLRQAVDLWARIQGGSSALPIEEIEP
jgi:hypothetical protein